jgi:predicted DNA-binding protein with PD1-like motif
VDGSLKDDVLLVRLSDGDDLEVSLKKVLKENNITAGVFIGGVGMLRNAGLSFYVGKGRYETVPLDGPVELCALSGNVSTMEGEIAIHLHAVVGGHGGRALAGHLSGGQVNMTAEIAILVTPQKLVRYADPGTGLKMLRFE